MRLFANDGFRALDGIYLMFGVGTSRCETREKRKKKRKKRNDKKNAFMGVVHAKFQQNW